MKKFPRLQSFLLKVFAVLAVTSCTSPEDEKLKQAFGNEKFPTAKKVQNLLDQWETSYSFQPIRTNSEDPTGDQILDFLLSLSLEQSSSDKRFQAIMNFLKNSPNYNGWVSTKVLNGPGHDSAENRRKTAEAQFEKHLQIALEPFINSSHSTIQSWIDSGSVDASISGKDFHRLLTLGQ